MAAQSQNANILAKCVTLLHISILLNIPALSLIAGKSYDEETTEFFSGHTNNWAIIVCASRFWFNYRHVANALSIYRSVKRLGIPDSQIILMLADDMPCNSRNPSPATVFNNANQQINVYGDDIEVDYRGNEVTVENLIRVLTGRQTDSTPRSKRLLSDDRSNILVYMSGHGGDGFLKFQDSEEVTDVELADAFEQMWQKRRYHELLFIVDTCQGASLYAKFYSPNIIGVASSLVGEDSMSHHSDPSIGVYVIDRYTYYALEFLERVRPGSKRTMEEFLRVCPKHQCHSTVGVRTDLFTSRPVKRVLVTDFFGSVRQVELYLKAAGVESNDTRPAAMGPDDGFLDQLELEDVVLEQQVSGSGGADAVDDAGRDRPTRDVYLEHLCNTEACLLAKARQEKAAKQRQLRYANPFPVKYYAQLRDRI